MVCGVSGSQCQTQWDCHHENDSYIPYKRKILGHERHEVNLQYFFIIMYAKPNTALQDKVPDQDSESIHFLRCFFPPIEDKLSSRRRKNNQNIHPTHSYMGNVKTVLKLLHLKQA